MTDRIDEFTYRRVHTAPRDLVFECLTTPAHLAEFWGPLGTHTPVERIVVDLRPEGVFETTMVNDNDGSEYRMRATFVAVDPPVSLSWRDDESGVLTNVTLHELADDLTEVVTKQNGLPPEYRTSQARSGWESSLDRFAMYLTELSSKQSEATSEGRK